MSAKFTTIRAFAAALPEGLPETIQFMPPGVHKICAMRNDEPAEMEIEVTEAVAKAIEADFLRISAEAAKGNGPKAYLDLNHEDREASAWVKSVTWAGNDPVNGGIRIALEWSKAGKEAIEGKNFRAFSPNFMANESGEVTGTTANMGGLVNRPAFKSIQTLFAKDAQTIKATSMETPLIKALIAAGILSGVPADEAAAIAEIQKNSGQKTEVEAKLKTAEADATKAKEEVKAKDTELADVKAKLARLNESNAENICIKALEADFFLPKDAEARARFKTFALASPEQAEALVSDRVKAKAAGGNSDVTRTVIGSQSRTITAAPGSEAEQYVAQVKAKATELNGKTKSPMTDAIKAVNATSPKLLEAYREAGSPAIA